MATTQSYRVISDEHIQIFRRQQDDLPAHIKRNAYFENHRHQHKDTGYYINLPKKTHVPIKFIQANDTYFWVGLLFRDNAWITNQGGILKTSLLSWWIKSNPQHPNYMFYAQEASVPLTITAVTIALQQLPICPNTPDHPTAMEGQQEEVNITTGQAQQEAQRINIISNPSNGTLKGNPPPMLDGDRDKTHKFLLNWDLWAAVNQANDTMKKPFSRIITMLSYMDGTCIDAWKEKQLQKLKEEMNDGALETDETLWDHFLERFKNTFINQNC